MHIVSAAGDIEVKSLNFQEFGKNIPKKASLSPDSFIQLALQVKFFFFKPIIGFFRLHSTGCTENIRQPMKLRLCANLLMDERTQFDFQIRNLPHSWKRLQVLFKV